MTDNFETIRGEGEEDDLQPGQILGNYRIIRYLAAGAMGKVYEAEHTVLRKRHAIKLIRSKFARHESFLSEFRYEARLLAALEHDHIVRVTDYGTEGPLAYFVMDFICGPDGEPYTLQDELGPLAKHTALDPKQVKTIALQICDALEFAHNFQNEGIVHRDLKPGNIMLRKERGGQVRVAVADFGLARMLGNDSSLRTMVYPMTENVADLETMVEAPLTNQEITGTPPYMSTEQWLIGAVLTPASDMYSLGVILYQCLTGELPYVDSRVLNQNPPAPAPRPPSSFGCAKTWDPIIEKCLQKFPQDRYSTAGALAEAIRSMDGPVRPEGPVAAGLLKKVASAAVLAAVLAGTGTWVWHRSRPAAGPSTLLPDGKVSFQLRGSPPGASVRIMRAGKELDRVDNLSAQGVTLPLDPGTYSFTIAKPGYRRLEKQVDISVDQPVWTFALPEITGTLRVESIPLARVVALAEDGVRMDLGSTDVNGILQKSLRAGAYGVVLSHPDFVAATNAVTVEADVFARLNHRLEGRPSSLQVASEVPGEVWLEDKRLGVTGEPIAGLQPGNYAFELRRNGYRTETLQCTVPPNQLYVLEAPAPMAIAGMVRLEAFRGAGTVEEAVPVQGILRLDNQPGQPVSLPQEWAMSDTRPHRLVLEVEGYDPAVLENVAAQPDHPVTARFKLLAKMARIRVVAPVEEAEVFLGNERLGRVGESLKVPPFLRHTLTLRAPGYRERNMDIVIADPDAAYPDYRVALDPLPSALVIQAITPEYLQRNPQVEILLDDKSLGLQTLPYRIEPVPAGPHRVELVSARFEDIPAQDVEVERGAEAKLKFKLLDKRIHIQIEVIPADATVRINGKTVSERTIPVAPEIPIRINVEAPNHDPKQYMYTARPGASRDLKIELVPHSFITFNVTPGHASIYVKGKRIDSKTMRVNPGEEYMVTVRAKDYEPFKETYRGIRGKNQQVQIELKKKGFF